MDLRLIASPARGASGRQRGSVVHGSVRVRERVVVSASGQAAEAAHKSRDKIRLG